MSCPQAQDASKTSRWVATSACRRISGPWQTDLGAVDVMQWIEGIDVEELYSELRAAGRPRDLDDLEHLPAADR